MSDIKSYPATDTVKESQRVLGYDPSGAQTISITIKDLREYIEINSSLPAAQVTFDPDGTSIIATDVQAALVYIDANLGDLSSLDTINNDQWSGTDLALVNGGTGASDKEGASTNLGLITASLFATYGGTTNVITLTTSRTLSALTIGQGFWFIPTVTNTTTVTCDIDGIGVVTLKTVTGVNLPAGYLLADTPTFMLYDGTNLICDRQIENGTNANGDFTRYADGTMICTYSQAIATTFIAAGALFRDNNVVVTLPATFIAAPVATGQTLQNNHWTGRVTTTTTTADYAVWDVVSGATTTTIVGDATGFWYL